MNKKRRKLDNVEKVAKMAQKEHPSILFPQGSVEVSRIMGPDDTNIAGNVHGGTIMKMIEEAGTIIATRHCNKNRTTKTDPAVWACLARVEKTDFVKPMFVGEVATVHADLTYSSRHSLEVQVLVFAENLTKGEHKLTNKACLWYVAVASGFSEGSFTLVEVPQLEYKSKEEEEAGRRRYEQQVKSRKTKEELLSKIPCGIAYPISGRNSADYLQHGVSYSASSLTHAVQPSDCNMFKYCNGGVTMKLMDTVAGIVAFRHAQRNIVTASIDAIDFHKPVKLGEVMTITGRMTFTSEKSMEIKVVIDVENLLEGRCFRALSAFFYFVALDPSGRPCKVPPLEVVTVEEKQRFAEGKSRYETRKQRKAGI